MKILALDTSNQTLSVAVMLDDQVLATTTVTTTKKHATQLLPIIQSAMSAAKLKPADLDRVIVADGPGSYTGLRIGVTTAKTLADTLAIELVGVSSLATIAANIINEPQLVAVLFDGRNDNVFAGVYRIENGVPVSVIKDQHIAFEKLLPQLKALSEPIVVLGDLDSFTERLKTALEANFIEYPIELSLPSAVQLGRLGQRETPVSDVNSFVPRYLRLTKAEADWQKQHPEEDSSDYVEKV
ncbi:tRNA (adenosine(37)-N6)-threonylcarbamoyltransferase complex dimerization subunit type 1 TsaB [Lactobacillus sp. LC28-10]|uniref:tRNA (Adenosine(37)-N6)-threonylcarbamoyltransferase complex dimerization subunit type 1 TsaB n=1 Tax=Secundilactobacillus angelensis TaxID=2722706 RepID=A0ABX1KX56_9LACO|nr:tRNA (adenosine(37)-N6)-threonylcarbamoyltransferase complex dimerization subunit type 1 TsaB [Secundilactobacillus angelensis]MCH5462221.1 tRNA (adenosine(37)-N6)-threonylcarbamoyltransferase complex dimerization subunit type 1 TsaB [Secundilactobacillus angelensis]NLR18512.1 tRNA (adenosine(37)-N6)-threonylcarbamoyltransferase complex dimerization subunit type 1 TsaB [Secundilactobacillus angelensis]